VRALPDRAGAKRGGSNTTTEITGDKSFGNAESYSNSLGNLGAP
jgi:hypothetical protein